MILVVLCVVGLAPLHADPQTEAEYRNAVAVFPELGNPSSVLAMETMRLFKQLVDAKDPAASSPNALLLVAALAAHNLQPASPAATTPRRGSNQTGSGMDKNEAERLRSAQEAQARHDFLTGKSPFTNSR